MTPVAPRVAPPLLRRLAVMIGGMAAERPAAQADAAYVGTEGDNIFNLASVNTDFSTLFAAAAYATEENFDTAVLSGADLITVFAPNNDAFTTSNPEFTTENFEAAAGGAVPDGFPDSCRSRRDPQLPCGNGCIPVRYADEPAG